MLKQEIILKNHCQFLCCHPDYFKGWGGGDVLDLPKHRQGNKMHPHAARSRYSIAGSENFKVNQR